MGWKGTMRSMAAASRAAARDAERRRKAAQKQQTLDDAYDAVKNWEEYVANLISVHVNLADSINWHKIAALPEPQKPNRKSEHLTKAERKLSSFKPTFITKLTGGTDKKLSKLKSALKLADEKDQKKFQNSLNKYEEKLKEWNDDTEMAKRLLSNDVEAFKEVISELKTFVEEDRIGDHINFQIMEDKVHAMPLVHSDEIIPKTRRKLRASGTLSETKMPAGEFNELYQDYVASVALKVAGDIFHVLPIETVFVTCMSKMLNTSTGYLEPTPILSVQFVKETFIKLNLKNVDPSDSLKNFNHAMNFKRTKGFVAIEPLEPLERDFDI